MSSPTSGPPVTDELPQPLRASKPVQPPPSEPATPKDAIGAVHAVREAAASSKLPAFPVNTPKAKPASAAPLVSAVSRRPLIEVVGLRRYYGSLLAVRDVSFSVGKGEVVGFLGPNGAGKSTTLRMIVGYLGPSAGHVKVDGHDVVEEPLAARRTIGYMPEAAPLYPEMRVSEYLRFRARLKRINRGDVRAAVTEAMTKASVSEVAPALIGALSRGFCQRVALADALLGNPPLLILDEPTAGLDPNQIRSVRALIKQLSREHTVLLSTHILSEVESTCTRAVVINQGMVVAQGSIAELRRQTGSQRAVLTVHDREHQAYGLLVSARGVLGVTPQEALTPSESAASAFESPAQDAIVSLVVTFDPDVDAAECLEDMVAFLSRRGVGVREAQLRQTSLEEVFSQLTGAGPTNAGVTPS